MALPGEQTQPYTASLRLSSLQPGCHIARKALNPPGDKGRTRVFPARYGAWLACACGDFLILSPLGLLGHVRIDSPAKALEFVRLFTAPDTFDLVDMGGMVELVPGNPDPRSAFNIVPRPLFLKFCREATVDVGEPLAGQKIYYVKRPVVMIDQQVYELVEEVREDGLYEELSRKVVASADQLDILHMGPL